MQANQRKEWYKSVMREWKIEIPKFNLPQWLICIGYGELPGEPIPGRSGVEKGKERKLQLK